MVSGRDILLDAGPVIGFLDRRDQWHASSARGWPRVVERCVTTEAVLAEASHVIGRRGGSFALPVELVLAAGVPVVTLDDDARTAAAALMRRYENLPMDYADATLVVLGEALGVERVFTFDERGFAAYRTGRGRGFEVVEG